MIVSLQNEQVKHVVSLHDKKGRKEYREFLVEGKRFVQEAILRQAQLKKIYYTAQDAAMEKSDLQQSLSIGGLVTEIRALGIEAEEVSEAVMRKMSATEEPQGILGIIRKTEFDWQDILIEKDTILLVVDGIQDPGNLGTILRTALAADVKQIILTKKTVDLYNPKVLRSSMGSVFSEVILADKTPEEIAIFCRQKECSMVVSTMGGTSIFKTNIREDYPLALIMGNEATGPSAFFMEKAAKHYSIPMFNNVESLNASMAAGIFLYEMRRQGQFL